MTVKKLLIPDFKSLKAAIKNPGPQPPLPQDSEDIQSVGPSTQIGRYSSQIIDSQEIPVPPPKQPTSRRRRSEVLSQPPAVVSRPTSPPTSVCVKLTLPADPKQHFTQFFPWSDDLLELNVSVFGNKNGYREHQQEAVNAVMDQFDVFVILPTGGGKSLIFQLPAVASPGLTVVVMPLVSLINDQVQHMNRLGVPVVSLVGEVSKTTIEKTFQDIRQNRVCILYITPERIAKSRAIIDLFSELNNRNLLRRFVIDEAHCVSTMGHSFRSDYLELKILRTQFRNVPLLALTATATQMVVQDVLAQLGLCERSVFVIKGSLDRLNLKWQVFEKKRTLTEDIFRIIRNDYSDGSSGIIYCLSQAQCEKTATELRTRGVRAAHYHAAMSQRDRETAQREWMEETVQVVCATIAFGMGINKPNVRFVMHHSLPKSMENLYQEQGRAGRDGIPSRCMVWYDYGDKIRNHGLICSEKSRHVDQQVAALLEVVKYCEDKVTCRRKIFASHFGEMGQHTCRQLLGQVQQCDVCESGSSSPENIVVEDCTGIGQKIFTVLQEIDGMNGGSSRHKGRFSGQVPHPTAVQLKDIVLGTLGTDTSNRFKEWASLKNFACLRGEWGLNVKLMDLIHKMIVDGWIIEVCELNNYHGYTGHVRMGRGGGQVICRTPRLGLVDTFQFERSIRSALSDSRLSAAPPVQPVVKAHPLSKEQKIELKGAINHMRSQIAKEEKTLPFEVFPDTTVLDLIEQLPQTVDDLEDIDKLNDRKIHMYGERIIECIRGFMEENGLEVNLVRQTACKVKEPNPSDTQTPIRMVTNPNGDVSLKDLQSTADTQQTFSTRFAKKRKSSSGGIQPRSSTSQATTSSNAADELKHLCDEAIIDLCTSPILPQKTEQMNSIQFEDISDEYLQWLKREGVI